MRSNFLQINVDNVAIHNFSACTNNGEFSFEQNGFGGGHLDSSGRTKVLAVDFAAWLQEHELYDLIKVDIEGTEREFLPYIFPHISKVQYLIVEYHFEIGKDQNLDEISNLLRTNGYRYHMKNVDNIEAPLHKVQAQGFDDQLDIFASREPQ